MIKVEIKNGRFSIDTREVFNPGVINFTKKNAIDLAILFNKEQGSYIDVEMVDIDLLDVTKAFEYDMEGNPVIHKGGNSPVEFLYYTVREYAKRGIESNVTEVTFDIDDDSINGQINLTNCSIECFNISPEEINLDGTDLEASYVF